nr:MAG TPA: antitoxin [Caudoviricetes sp.]
MCVRGVLREVMVMGLSQELLAKLFCYDIANFNNYYVNSHPPLKRRITRILKAVK